LKNPVHHSPALSEKNLRNRLLPYAFIRRTPHAPCPCAAAPRPSGLMFGANWQSVALTGLDTIPALIRFRWAAFNSRSAQLRPLASLLQSSGIAAQHVKSSRSWSHSAPRMVGVPRMVSRAQQQPAVHFPSMAWISFEDAWVSSCCASQVRKQQEIADSFPATTTQEKPPSLTPRKANASTSLS